MRGVAEDFNGRDPDTGKLQDDQEDRISVYSAGAKSHRSGTSNTSMSSKVAERYKQKKMSARPSPPRESARRD